MYTYVYVYVYVYVCIYVCICTRVFICLYDCIPMTPVNTQRIHFQQLIHISNKHRLKLGLEPDEKLTNKSKYIGPVLTPNQNQP